MLCMELNMLLKLLQSYRMPILCNNLTTLYLHLIVPICLITMEINYKMKIIQLLKSNHVLIVHIIVTVNKRKKTSLNQYFVFLKFIYEFFVLFYFYFFLMLFMNLLIDCLTDLLIGYLIDLLIDYLIDLLIDCLN